MWRRLPADSNRRLLLSGRKEEDAEPRCDHPASRPLISPHIYLITGLGVSLRPKPNRLKMLHTYFYLSVLQRIWSTAECFLAALIDRFMLWYDCFSYIFMSNIFRTDRQTLQETNISFRSFLYSPVILLWLCLILKQCCLPTLFPSWPFLFP